LIWEQARRRRSGSRRFALLFWEAWRWDLVDWSLVISVYSSIFDNFL
jgi:hypothetical protein